ncbi:cytochrome P450 [Lepidopterella palustris CBS 459.81]|uniref:Cytochrome P450 n=1 Tax=Lepidopterella palustris CBS 459.81 TaxID=1314670 RepID=A0A8E2EHA9_9PEZI|nr:cytochrome P450 [Lepidopterella palustris CBS 459.81]
MGKYRQTKPVRVHPHLFPNFLTEDYDLPPVYYVDLYPLSSPLLVIHDPEIAQDIAANSGMKKHPTLKDYIKPLGGENNMITMEGAAWKKWRSIFNPGFSSSYLMTQVPAIVDCVLDFASILDEYAEKNKLFRLEEALTRLTIDIIGKVIIDHDFKSQRSRNAFVELIRAQIAWLPNSQSLNPFHIWNPLRPIMYWLNTRRLDAYIGKILDDRFSTHSATDSKSRKQKISIDLALETYFKENNHNATGPDNLVMDAEFRQYAIDNFKLLIFAGHDTTSSTVCYAYHLLSKSPSALAAIRAEHDAVFGTNPLAAAEILKNSPHLINKLEYTLAVVREVLRLFPPASTVRIGREGYFVKDPVTGKMLPTEGFLIWVHAIGMHRSPRLWGPDVHSFVPERFLPENSSKVPPNAWRPFEKGPRNCIGQELALLEVKIILVLTLRMFDVRAAYGELDKLSGDGSLWAKDKAGRKGVQETWGEEAYQVLLASAKPREGMPARARRREF